MRFNFFQNLKFNPGIPSRQLAVFAKELKFLLEAGIPLVRGLSIIERQMSSRNMRSSIRSMIDDVSSGIPLSKALAKQAGAYPETFINIVQAGEGSGILEKSLGKAASYFEMKDSLRKKIVGALVYPSVVLSLSFLSVILIAMFLIPTMNGVFNSLNIELPLMTRMLGSLGDGIVKYWIFIIILSAISYYLLKNGAKRKFGEDFFERVALSLPVIGDIRKKAILSNLSSTLSSLLSSGVPLVGALSVSSAASGSGVYRGAMTGIINKVESGEPLSSSLRESNLFPGSFCEMVNVGESTAKLDIILADLSGYYEREVESQIKVLASLVEPLSTVVVGGAVAVVVFSLFSPILSIVDALAK